MGQSVILFPASHAIFVFYQKLLNLLDTETIEHPDSDEDRLIEEVSVPHKASPVNLT